MIEQGREDGPSHALYFLKNTVPIHKIITFLYTIHVVTSRCS